MNHNAFEDVLWTQLHHVSVAKSNFGLNFVTSFLPPSFLMNYYEELLLISSVKCQEFADWIKIL